MGDTAATVPRFVVTVKAICATRISESVAKGVRMDGWETDVNTV